MKLSQVSDAKLCEAVSRILLGCTAEKTDPTDFDAAHANILKGIFLLEERGALAFSAAGYLYLGEFLADAGRRSEAFESLKKAEAIYREIQVIPDSYWLARTREALAGLGA
ncbi:MAG: hypothetical protein EHM36_09915 [Deltaproteobacteria bacterium]|nr:MAG: hypothetical protein EHM36_09915 [Deltaproteobacteria bacterium]